MRRSKQVPELDDPRADGEDDPLKKVVAAALFGDAVERPRVGRFEITGELGRGGMGEVLAAHDDELDRRVAIKLLHSEIGESQAVRLKREARALAKLSHPNVVQVYEVGTYEGRVFIAMEFVEGKTLRAWVRQDEPSPDEIFRVFREAAVGLSAAHGAGLIHRDFKPDNVLLGSDGRPRILDFGLARADGLEDDVDIEQALAELESSAVDMGVFDDTIQATITRTGAILGTPAYMSPEQFTGSRVTAASDQFSFCVALWEALHGARPFQGGSIGALSTAVADGTLARPDEEVTSAGVRRVIERGLAATPGDRHRSMSEFIDALDDELERPGRRRRYRWLAAGVGAVLAAGVGGFALVNRTPEVVTAPAQPTGPQPPAGFCAPLEERLEGIWDEPTKAAIAERYENGVLRGQQWWRFEERNLDEWVDDWGRIYTESCETEFQTDLPRFSLRQTCLDQRMTEIETRVRLLQALTPGERMDLGVQNYAPYVVPKECESAAVVSAVSLYPSNRAERDAFLKIVLDYRFSVALTAAAFFGANSQGYRDAVSTLTGTAAAVEETGFEPMIAEVYSLQGNGLVMGGVELERGFRELDEAQRLGKKSRAEHVRVLAGVWALEQSTLLGPEGRPTLRDDDLDSTFEEWEMALESVGSPVYGSTELYSLWAQYRALHDDPDGVREKGQLALDAALSGWGPDSLYAARVYADVSQVYATAGLHDQSRVTRDQALAMHEQIFGPDSVSTTFILFAAFNHALGLGDLEAAEQAMLKRRRMVHKHYEPGLVIYRGVELNLALLLMSQGNFEEGDAALRPLDEQGPSFVSGLGDEWRTLRLLYTASVGEPDRAARSAANANAPFPAVEELASLLRPVLEGESAKVAEAHLREELARARYAVPKAAGLIQLGRLQAKLGKRAQARANYQTALEMDLNPDNLGVLNFQPFLRAAAQHQLDQLGG